MHGSRLAMIELCEVLTLGGVGAPSRGAGLASRVGLVRECSSSLVMLFVNRKGGIFGSSVGDDGEVQIIFLRTIAVMARIHIESDDELPELDEILGAKSTRTKSTRSDGRKKSPTRPKPQTASAKDEILPTKSKQRSLKKIDPMQSLFGPFDASKAFEPTKVETRRKEVRSSPRKGKTVKQIKIFEDEDVKEVKPAIEVDDIHPSEENEEIEEIEETQGLEEVAPVVEDEGPSISSSEEDSYHVSEDSGSDDESWLGFKKDRESPFKRLLKSRPRSKIDLEDPKLQLSPTKVTEPANPFLGPRIAPPITSPPRPTSSSSALDNAAILHYTPPKRVSPSKKKQTSTPPREPEVPPSPSKRLNSPTKARFTNIPRAAVRESLDAFWSQDAVNDWNEQYSPRKMVGSPRKTRFATPNSDDEGAENGGPPSPSTSPRKSRSPAKNASPVKSKEAREMKKAWDVRKKKMAQEFLDELDKTIAEGKISEMAAATGGIQIIWNKKLKTTAGRANWKREKIRDLQPDKSTRTWFKHTANVELAEKVIDDEVKLINVVAHEFCHLCNFMISGVRDNPHGRQFKEWYVLITF